jgi:hypothetical protein
VQSNIGLKRQVNALLLFAGLSLSSVPLAFSQSKTPSPEVHSANADLNGDGTQEKIQISADRSSRGAFFLSVNGVKLPKAFSTYDDTTPGFRIVKIDSASKTRQIALHIPGPNDDGETFFYCWDGKSIRNIGEVPNAETISGNRVVYGGIWMAFWTCKQKYAFNPKTQTLTFVRQPVYPVDIPATVKETFPIFREHTTGSATAATVSPGSKIHLVSFWAPTAEPKDSLPENRWFLVRTAKGISGWARFDTFTEKVDGLPYAG